MSDNKTDNPKITAIKKEKDPKRVEAGKRLAAISKEAKERKMRQRIKEEDKDKSWNIDYGFLFGFIGVVTAIGSLYYTRKDYNKTENDTEETKASTKETKASTKETKASTKENTNSCLNENL